MDAANLLFSATSFLKGTDSAVKSMLQKDENVHVLEATHNF